MGDSDEEEMQKLRKSTKYRGVQKQDTKPNDQLSEQLPNKDNSEDNLLQQFNLPTSFGAKTQVKKASSDFIEKTKRSAPGPQRPGPQRAVTQESTEEQSRVEKTLGEPDEDDFIGPPRPASLEKNENEIQEFEDEDSNFYNIPYSHEIKLEEHSKTVSALSLDPAGGRLISGGFDYNVKFWDFAGMDRTFRSFRTVEPAEGNQISSLQFSITGDRFLVTPATWQARIYDRDGHDLATTVRGDMYLTDLNNTKGHTSTINNAMWHPTTKDMFLTSSQDGSIRLWDVEKMSKTHKSLIKVKSQTGRRVGASYACFNRDGNTIVGAAQDGSIQIWSSKGPFSKPANTIKSAHQDGFDVTSMCFSDDGYTLVSRCTDDTMKVWDIRNTSRTIASFEDLPNFEQTQCIFSPDNRLIITGTSVKKGDGSGSTGLLVFYDKTLLSRVKQIGVSPGAGVVTMLWHQKINQLIVGCSDGKIRVLYDPKMSINGALLSVVRNPRQADPNDYEPPRPILTPHSLPMYQESLNSKRKQARERYDPRKSAKIDTQPKEPTPRTSASLQLLQGWIKKDQVYEDPREEILKHADADANPQFFGVYKKTQPKPIFSKEPEPEEHRVRPEKK